MNRSNRWIVFLLITVSLLLSACSQASQAPAKIKPAILEPVEGTKFNRVTLTEKAAERLGIQTVAVSEQQLTRMRTLVGEVVASPLGTVVEGSDTTTVPDLSSKPGEAFVLLRMNQIDRSQIDGSFPAQVYAPEDDDSDEGLLADMFEDEAGDDDVEDDLSEVDLYYKINSLEHGLVTGQNVRVAVALAGNEALRKVIPYSAILYDLDGSTFVYTSPESLVFVRQPVTVDYIDGDFVVLEDGPSAGTEIVTVGVAELYGIDTGVGK